MCANFYDVISYGEDGICESTRIYIYIFILLSLETHVKFLSTLGCDLANDNIVPISVNPRIVPVDLTWSLSCTNCFYIPTTDIVIDFSHNIIDAITSFILYIFKGYFSQNVNTII